MLKCPVTTNNSIYLPQFRLIYLFAVILINLSLCVLLLLKSVNELNLNQSSMIREIAEGIV